MDTLLLVKTTNILLFCAPLYDIVCLSFTYRVSAISCFIVIGVSSCWCAATSHALCIRNISQRRNTLYFICLLTATAVIGRRKKKRKWEKWNSSGTITSPKQETG